MGSTTPKTASMTMPTSCSAMPNLKCRSYALKVSSRFSVHQKPAKRNPSKMLETGRVARTPSPNCTAHLLSRNDTAAYDFACHQRTSTSTATHQTLSMKLRQFDARVMHSDIWPSGPRSARHVSIICQSSNRHLRGSLQVEQRTVPQPSV